MGLGSGTTTTTTSGPDPESAKIAADAQIQATELATQAAKENLELAISELRGAEERARADLGPQQQLGFSAVDQLSDLIGLSRPRGGSSAFAQLDAEGRSSAEFTDPFENQRDALENLLSSPEFDFQREQGIQAIDRAASAKGLLGSGARLKELQNFGQQFAAQQIGTKQSNLAALAGLGSQAGSNLAQLGANTAGQISAGFQGFGDTAANAQLAAGQARANQLLGPTTSTQVTKGGGGLAGFGSLFGGLASLATLL